MEFQNKQFQFSIKQNQSHLKQLQQNILSLSSLYSKKPDFGNFPQLLINNGESIWKKIARDFTTPFTPRDPTFQKMVLPNPRAQGKDKKWALDNFFHNLLSEQKQKKYPNRLISQMNYNLQPSNTIQIRDYCIDKEFQQITQIDDESLNESSSSESENIQNQQNLKSDSQLNSQKIRSSVIEQRKKIYLNYLQCLPFLSQKQLQEQQLFLHHSKNSTQINKILRNQKFSISENQSSSYISQLRLEQEQKLKQNKNISKFAKKRRSLLINNQNYISFICSKGKQNCKMFSIRKLSHQEHSKYNFLNEKFYINCNIIKQQPSNQNSKNQLIPPSILIKQNSEKSIKSINQSPTRLKKIFSISFQQKKKDKNKFSLTINKSGQQSSTSIQSGKTQQQETSKSNSRTNLPYQQKNLTSKMMAQNIRRRSCICKNCFCQKINQTQYLSSKYSTKQEKYIEDQQKSKQEQNNIIQNIFINLSQSKSQKKELQLKSPLFNKSNYFTFSKAYESQSKTLQQKCNTNNTLDNIPKIKKENQQMTWKKEIIVLHNQKKRHSVQALIAIQNHDKQKLFKLRTMMFDEKQNKSGGKFNQLDALKEEEDEDKDKEVKIKIEKYQQLQQNNQINQNKSAATAKLSSKLSFTSNYFDPKFFQTIQLKTSNQENNLDKSNNKLEIFQNLCKKKEIIRPYLKNLESKTERINNKESPYTNKNYQFQKLKQFLKQNRSNQLILENKNDKIIGKFMLKFSYCPSNQSSFKNNKRRKQKSVLI